MDPISATNRAGVFALVAAVFTAGVLAPVQLEAYENSVEDSLEWSTEETTVTTTRATEHTSEPTAPDRPDGHDNTQNDELADTMLTVSTAVAGGVVTTAAAIVVTSVLASNGGAELYLRTNAVALRHHLRRGTGSTLDDLAQLCRIPTALHPRFVDALHENRRALIPLLDDELYIDEGDTRRFLNVIAEVIVEDSQLSMAVLGRPIPGRTFQR